MNKKEISEIRKLFSKEHCNIARICSCYVDAEKNKKSISREAFLSLQQEETFKYFEILKKTLSGSIGKNLLNVEFPLIAEEEEGTQAFLLKLRNSKLKDDELTEQFFDRIIENYQFDENYYIVLIHAVYDIPGKTSDGIVMEDASDNIYEYLVCSICPVKLAKPGLSYNLEKNLFENRIRDWLVDAPVNGFLFPTFTDRLPDIHSALYYSKKAEDIRPEFIESVLGSQTPMTADAQRETFQAILTDILDDECKYEIVRNVHETIQEMLEENKENPEPLELSKYDVKHVLMESGVSEEKIREVEEEYDNTVGEKVFLMAENIVDTRKFNIDTPDVRVKVNPERTDLIETRVIDGRKYILIAVEEGVEVNGVQVRI